VKTRGYGGTPGAIAAGMTSILILFLLLAAVAAQACALRAVQRTHGLPLFWGGASTKEPTP